MGMEGLTPLGGPADGAWKGTSNRMETSSEGDAPDSWCLEAETWPCPGIVVLQIAEGHWAYPGQDEGPGCLPDGALPMERGSQQGCCRETRGAELGQRCQVRLDDISAESVV